MTVADSELDEAMAALRVVHSIHIDFLASLPEHQANTIVNRLGVNFRSFLDSYCGRHLIIGLLTAADTEHVDEIHVHALTNDGAYLPLYAFHATVIPPAGLAILRREAADWTAMQQLLNQAPPDDLSGLEDPAPDDSEA